MARKVTSRRVTSRRRLGTLWAALALAAVLWQAMQAVTLGIVGVPGLWSVPLQAPEEEPDFVIPPQGELRQWVRARAFEFAGGVDEAGRILYGFDVWLEPPAAISARIASVDYGFEAPSARPESQSSGDRREAFRVRFGAAACAPNIRVVMSFEDGRVREIDVDGCAILS